MGLLNDLLTSTPSVHLHMWISAWKLTENQHFKFSDLAYVNLMWVAAIKPKATYHHRLQPISATGTIDDLI